MLSFNNADTIEKAIGSILMQKTDYPYMISIYDNGSTDNSRVVIDKIAKDNKNIKTNYNDVNIGWAKNFIKSIEFSKGDYLAFLDADDHWVDDCKIQKQIECFNTYHCAIVHTSGIIRSDGVDKILKVRELSAKDLIKVNPIIWQTVMVSAEKINLVISSLKHFIKKFKSEPMVCDYIVLIELIRHGIQGIDDVTAVHVKNKGSVSHPQKTSTVLLRHYRAALVRLSYSQKLNMGFVVEIMIIIRSIRRCFIQLRENRAFRHQQNRR